MPSAVKEKFISDLTEELKESSHIILTDYQGLTADELYELRSKLRPHGTSYKVIKNRLAKIVLKNVGKESLAPDMKGPTAIAFKGEDIAAINKTLFKFSEDHKKLKVKAGHVFGNAVDAKSLRSIASLPSREVLLATLLTRLLSPLQTLAATLIEPVRALQASLSAVAKKKESAPPA